MSSSLSLSNILFGVSKSGILDFLRALFLFVDYIMKRFRKQKNKKHGAMDETRFCVCTSIFVYSNIWKKASINRWHHTADGKRICKPLFVCFLFRICEFFNGGRAFQICEPQKKKKNEINSNCQQKGKYRCFFRYIKRKENSSFIEGIDLFATQGKDHLLSYIRTYICCCVLNFLVPDLVQRIRKRKDLFVNNFIPFKFCICNSHRVRVQVDLLHLSRGGGGWFNMLDNITVGERNENKKQVKFKWIKNFRNIEPNVYTILITKRVWFISSPVVIV